MHIDVLNVFKDSETIRLSIGRTEINLHFIIYIKIGGILKIFKRFIIINGLQPIYF